MADHIHTLSFTPGGALDPSAAEKVHAVVQASDVKVLNVGTHSVTIQGTVDGVLNRLTVWNPNCLIVQEKS